MNIWLIAAGLCLAYDIALHISAGLVVDFSWIWLVGTVGFGALGVLGYWHKGWFVRLPLLLRSTVILIALAMAGLCMYLMGCVISGMKQKENSEADYVVILGAHVNGEVPSRSLKYRLDTAVSYADEYPDAILVLTGGQGSGENITEAECMFRYLTEMGISADRLVKEERSTTTRENLRFADELTGCFSKRLGILSNDFHIYRALKLAKLEGAQQVVGLPAPTGPVMKLHFMVREAAALVKVWLQELRG